MALPVRDFLAEEHRRQSVDIRDATGSELQVRRGRWYWYLHSIHGESNKGMYAVDVKDSAVSEHEVGLAHCRM